MSRLVPRKKERLRETRLRENTTEKTTADSTDYATTKIELKKENMIEKVV